MMETFLEAHFLRKIRNDFGDYKIDRNALSSIEPLGYEESSWEVGIPLSLIEELFLETITVSDSPVTLVPHPPQNIQFSFSWSPHFLHNLGIFDDRWHRIILTFDICSQRIAHYFQRPKGHMVEISFKDGSKVFIFWIEIVGGFWEAKFQPDLLWKVVGKYQSYLKVVPPWLSLCGL